MLIAAILTLFQAEAPNPPADKLASYAAGVERLARIDLEVTSGGRLVSSDVDWALVAAVQWYESRFRPEPPDGDCTELGLLGAYRRTCQAVGPMQLNTAAGWFLRQELPSLAGARAAQLREPQTNVLAGYATLNRWKGICGGPPAIWLTAYGWGRCPQRTDWEGARRCALATALLDRAGTKPDGWICGHEKRTVDQRTRFLIRKLRAAP